MNNQVISSQADRQSVVATLFKSLYMQMAAALTITGLTAYFIASSPDMLATIFSNRSSVWILLFAQLGVVMWLSSRALRMSMAAATLLFILYSVLTGVTFSVIFLAYTGETIATTFFITAGTFLAMSIVGYVTRMDLTRIGSILFMLLIGVIIATVVNIFMHSETIYWVTTYAGVVIFVGLIAFDTQKLKHIFMSMDSVDETSQKVALLGALTLYLDFINLFLFLRRIWGATRYSA
ncbi:MAG: Bax inhibitor-1/YccA family protein [Alistipes sp.]|nr:Bax inhibitor-1/YccA family protein [Alistipes sp.]